MNRVRDNQIVRISVVFERNITAIDKAVIEKPAVQTLSKLYGLPPNKTYFRTDTIICEFKSLGKIIDTQDLTVYGINLNLKLEWISGIKELHAEGRDQYDRQTFSTDYIYKPIANINSILSVDTQTVVSDSPLDNVPLNNQPVIPYTLNLNVQTPILDLNEPTFDLNSPIVDLTIPNSPAFDLNFLPNSSAEPLNIPTTENSNTSPLTIPSSGISPEDQAVIDMILREQEEEERAKVKVPVSAAYINPDDIIITSNISLEFDEATWKKQHETTIVNVIQHVWTTTNIGNAHKIMKIVGVGGKKSTYRIEFQNNGHNFPIKFLSDFVNILALVAPEIYQFLVSVYYDGTSVFGPKHRSDCESSHASLIVADEICMNDNELESTCKFFFPRNPIPNTRSGCIELIKTKFGANQNTWPNLIMLDFYQLLWSITQDGKPFPFKNSNEASQFFKKEKIITHESQVWPANIEISFPNWRDVAPNLTDMSIGDIYKKYLDMQLTANNSLLPILYNQKTWLDDSEINSALVPYSNNPVYHFQHYVMRLAYGSAESNASYNPLSIQWMGDYPPPSVSKFAFVVNTDKKDLQGSHWTLIFVDIGKNTIDYMDPYARPPGKNVKEALTSVLDLIHAWFPQFNKNLKDVRRLTKAHQKLGNSCGVYVVHYAIERAKGVSFEDIASADLPDNKIDIFRGIYWRKNQ
jgi:hypothetical protein